MLALKLLFKALFAIIGKGKPHLTEVESVRIRGLARVDRRTKNLVKRLRPGDIAVIDHEDLDDVAAQALVEKRVKAVINAAHSISGKYPNQGPLTLVESGIVLIDQAGPEIMNLVETEELEIVEGEIYARGRLVAMGKALDRNAVLDLMEASKENLSNELDKFVQNTLDYAKKEKSLLLGELKIPPLRTVFRGRHTLIVVRGKNFKEDLHTIKPYINDVKPIVIGVDGGADALLDFGYRPDMIIGDMDSISDRALRCGAELIVHAYSDGRAPGLGRLESLGLPAITFAAPGTSEDVAMLLAHELGTELIVAVGTHSNMIDFLEKGRKGMSSTFLVRLKVGSILVDAKGVNKLYRHSVKFRYLAGMIAAAMLPLFIVFSISPTTRQFVRLLVLELKILFNI